MKIRNIKYLGPDCYENGDAESDDNIDIEKEYRWDSGAMGDVERALREAIEEVDHEKPVHRVTFVELLVDSPGDRCSYATREVEIEIQGDRDEVERFAEKVLRKYRFFTEYKIH